MRDHADLAGSVYIAGPLFSLAERSYIDRLAAELGRRLPGAAFVLPHRYAASVAGEPDFLERVFRWCMSTARASDAMVAILDGADADSGTCIEMGVVYGKVPIVGLRTDFRALEDRGVNVMVSRLCDEMVLIPDTSATIEEVADRVADALARVRPRHQQP